MTNMDAIKKLAAALLGNVNPDEISGRTIADVIEYIAENNSEGQARFAENIKKALKAHNVEMKNIIDERTVLNDGPYKNDVSLESINAPNITTLYDNVFNSCFSLTEAIMPNLTTMGSGCFSKCYSLKNIDFPKLITCGEESSDLSFQFCLSLAKVNLPKLTGNINSYMFNRCISLSDVNIPNATSISYSVFQDCYSLKSINLQNVTTIDSNAFGNCVMLTDINISSATSIGRNCFDGCYSLTQVNLPSVTNIGNYAFQNCFSLNTLILGANQVVTIPTSDSYDPFQGTLIEKGYGYIYVPDDLVDSYKSSKNANWLKYANQIKSISEAVE